MKKEKKDAFLIVRVPISQKDALLALAKEKKVVLSALTREIIADYLNGR